MPHRHPKPGTSTKADLLLHPVRLRIVLTLANAGQLTPLELCTRLPDVPQATLYRHLRQLAEGGIVQVVDERPVRGVVERRYALTGGAAVLGPAELAAASPDEHFRYFARFTASLLAQYARYLEGDTSGLSREVGYRQVPLYLDEAEFAAFWDELRTVLQRAVEKRPGPGRRRRLFTTIVMPDATPRADVAGGKEEVS